MPEYGRNVQKMLRYACTIQDTPVRQRFAEKVVDLMMQMNPQNKNLEDYREKLWKHAFHIADYKLNVVPPSGAIPTLETARKKPSIITYPTGETHHRHYGQNVQKAIRKAKAMPAGPKRDGMIRIIAAYMKLAYKTWNKEYFVSDEVIKSDLATISEGQLLLKDDAVVLQPVTSHPNQHSSQGQQNRRRRNGQGNYGGNHKGNSGNKDRYRNNKSRRKK